MAGVHGIAFPFRRGAVQFPQAADDDEAIAGNLKRCLLEQQGARVMRGNQGNGIWAAVFENTGPVLRARIDYETRKAIAAGEPRVKIVQIQIQESKNMQGEEYVDVNVVYLFMGQMQQVNAAFPR